MLRRCDSNSDHDDDHDDDGFGSSDNVRAAFMMHDIADVHDKEASMMGG